jgi:hypothetical protein
MYFLLVFQIGYRFQFLVARRFWLLAGGAADDKIIAHVHGLVEQ